MSPHNEEILLEQVEDFWLQQIFQLNREMLEELRHIRHLLEHQHLRTYPRTIGMRVLPS